MYARRLLALVLCSVLTGCHLFGGVRLEEVATSSQRPSNVAVYFSAANGKQPLTGLEAKNFTIYEDGQALSADQTQQTLLPRDVAAVHRALLLIDMSGAISEESARQIAEAAGRFVSAARRTQPVTVYAFDGGPRLRRIADYPQGEEAVDSVSGLQSYTSQDPSSNLHSAVVEALKELDTRLMTQAKPIRIGTLAVFVRGPDLAGRVEEGAMRDAVYDTQHHVLAIGIEGSEYDGSRLDEDGHFTASSLSTLNGAFTEAGERAARLTEQYYLISYCSPARAGTRRLKVEVTTTDAEGEDVRGNLTTEFDATGFTSGCNPQARPRFVVARSKADDSDDSGEPPAAGPSAGSAPTTASPPEAPDDEDAIVPPPDTPDYAQ